MKKYLAFILLISLFITFLPLTSSAQWGIGGGYEKRNGDPESGFNLRIEKGFKLPVPFIKFRGRLQGGVYTDESFSLFDEEVTFNRNAEVNSWYTGANLLAEVKLPILPVNPYGGLGIGFEKLNVDADEIFTIATEPAPPTRDNSEGDIFFEANAGLKITIIPLIKPFFEYRYVDFFDEPDVLDDNTFPVNTSLIKNSRFVFGVMLQF